MTELITRPAQVQDADAISALVNRAYRGDSSRAGWTTEADLLDGKRTTTEDVLALLNRHDAVIITGWVAETLMVTLCAEWHAEEQVAHLGMIAVEPTAQNQGYGKKMILVAEQLAVTRWGVRASQMAVVSVRETLIAFYQRLGYRATGELKPFPHFPEMWQPKMENMQLMTLQKDLVI